MTKEELLKFVQDIVKKSKELKDKYVDENNDKALYACIYCQSNEEYNHLVTIAKELGTIVEETPTGPFLNIQPLETVAGLIRLIKIRTFDAAKHLDLGHTDFPISNYDEFKKKYLGKDGFTLIKRNELEMIELGSKDFNVKVYFPNEPLEKKLRKQAGN